MTTATLLDPSDSAARSTTPRFPTLRVVSANPSMLLVRPQASLFMARYMRQFPARRFGDNLILHSHLPPLTSKAYSRFVAHHLVDRGPGPSHAQVGLTNACPQNCEYCYNKQRTGIPMDTPTILQAVDDLREAGVCWLGLTGGEPLLNRDILDIAAHASPDMAVKLFTTGVGLTPEPGPRSCGRGSFLRLREPRSLGSRPSQCLAPLSAGVPGGHRGHPRSSRKCPGSTWASPRCSAGA